SFTWTGLLRSRHKSSGEARDTLGKGQHPASAAERVAKGGGTPGRADECVGARVPQSVPTIQTVLSFSLVFPSIYMVPFRHSVVLRVVLPEGGHMSEAVTRGVRVTAQAKFHPEKSSKEDDYFFFSYQITIANEGLQTVQLLSRH